MSPESRAAQALPRFTRRSDGKVFRIVVQARSPTGPVELVADDGPPFEIVSTMNDRLAMDFIDHRDLKPEKQIAGPGLGDLARVAFDAYGASTGGKTWDGKDIPPFAVIRERTPHVAKAWEAAVAAVLKELETSR